MKRNTYVAALAALLCVWTLVFTSWPQTGSSAKHAFTPDAIPYGPAPASVPVGAQLAVLEGSPSKGLTGKTEISIDKS